MLANGRAGGTRNTQGIASFFLAAPWCVVLKSQVRFNGNVRYSSMRPVLSPTIGFVSDSARKEPLKEKNYIPSHRMVFSIIKRIRAYLPSLIFLIFRHLNALYRARISPLTHLPIPCVFLAAHCSPSFLSSPSSACSTLS